MIRRRGLVVVGACLLALTGCAGLPTTSTVNVGKAVSAGESPEPLTVMPDGPLPGDDPRQIATGFLRAHMWAANGYALAKSFLTAGGATKWAPGSSVTIFGDESAITATRPDVDTVRLRVPVVGTLSSDGHLTRRATPEQRTLEFRVEQGSSGWRLSDVPADLGLWLGEDDFDRLYTAANVYYPSAYGHLMVPDPRWLPRQGLGTALTRAALTPPPSSLAPAVRSPFPQGTSLDVESVPISGQGSAGIDLSDEAQAASTSDRAAMWASLVATVEQSPEVHSVSVSSRGARLETENLPSSVTAVSDVGFQLPAAAPGAVVVRTGRNLAWADPDASTADLGTTTAASAGRPTLPTVPSSWSMLAAGPGGRQLAALSQDRISLRRWLNGTQVTLSALGTDLVRPTFDVFGFLWTGGRSQGAPGDGSDGRQKQGPGAVWAIDTTKDDGSSAPAALSVPWLGTGQVDAVSLSPDGARVAVVVDRSGRREVRIAAVQRNHAGVPTSLGPSTVINGGADPRGVAWTNATELAVLTGAGDAATVALSGLDGKKQSFGRVSGATSITSTGGGTAGLFVGTSSGRVVGRLGSGWNTYLTGGEVAVPAS